MRYTYHTRHVGLCRSAVTPMEKLTSIFSTDMAVCGLGKSASDFGIYKLLNVTAALRNRPSSGLWS